MPALMPRNPHRNAPEYADRVNLIKKIKVGKDWRFAPVVPEANGRLKDKVRVNGEVEVHSEGSYYIEWWVSGRRFREATTREDAVECARHKSVELRAIRAGLIASPEPPPVASDKTPIGDAIDDYLKYVKMQRKSRTFLTYRYTLDVLLRASYKRKYVEDATRQDAIDFMTYCYEQGLGARTVYDKVVTVLQLFKRHGREKLLEKGDWPSYVDTIRPMYEPEELTAMFKVATQDEADMLKFILGSGFRDQEIRYVEYLDLDPHHDLVRVTAKKEWDFTPKNWEERVVPLPHVLVERLKKRKERKSARPHDLIFGNTRGNPDSEMDMVVKRVAQRAGLNCGRCVTEHGNKCVEGPYCMNFFLHKFRHTFATNHLRDGVDIRTVQAWLGHRDINSTMVYLKGIRSKDAAHKVNSGDSQASLLNEPEANLEAGANDAPASTVYCPYTDRDILLTESSPEHIIPLALGGMNGFTIAVSSDFNSRVGSEIDGALANDFLVKSKRDKHGAKGHSKKHPENIFPNASNADTGEPLHVTLGQVRGLRLWDPKQKRDVTGQGQKVNIGFKVDLDVAHRFVAKVALSAGYLVYGDQFRKHVKHEDFRKIMNQRPTEMGDVLKTIEAQYDDRFLEPESINQKILRMMMTGFGPHSAIALIPNSRSLSVVVSVLGDYIGMLSVPADTKTFPNTGEYRQGQFFVLKKPIPTRDSIWNLNQRMLARLEEFISKGK